MPPIEKTKIQIKITSRFSDEQGGRLYGPGVWDVLPHIAHRLVKQGRAVYLDKSAIAPVAPSTAPATTEAPANLRIPPVTTEDEPTATPLPEDFPFHELLVGAGFDTVESLKAPDIRQKLEAVKGLGPASVTKIGLAISKI